MYIVLSVASLCVRNLCIYWYVTLAKKFGICIQYVYSTKCCFFQCCVRKFGLCIVQSVASFSVVLESSGYVYSTKCCFFQCCVIHVSRLLCIYFCVSMFPFFPFVEMVQAIQAVIAIYKERLMAMPTAPDTSYRRAAFGVDGAVNRRFLWHLFFGLQYSHSVP